MEKKRDTILKIHSEIVDRIELRLKEFGKIWERGDDETLFRELVFCLLTPQSGARKCGQALENLIRAGHLFHGGSEEICRELNIVRFKNHKTSYIIEAREALYGAGKSIREHLNGCGSVCEMREWIAANVKGIGYKEASHYLRNIGLGDTIAILDRHILGNMHSLGLIHEIPKSIPARRYLDLERRLSNYSESIRVPLSHIDFVLWYKETGDIFK